MKYFEHVATITDPRGLKHAIVVRNWDADGIRFYEALWGNKRFDCFRDAVAFIRNEFPKITTFSERRCLAFEATQSVGTVTVDGIMSDNLTEKDLEVNVRINITGASSVPEGLYLSTALERAIDAIRARFEV